MTAHKHMTDPARHPRRSFVYRRLCEAGAVFEVCGDAAVATDYPGHAGLAQRLALVDLSPLPRLGFKGPRALSWLRRQVGDVPDDNNRAYVLGDGALVARLTDTEALILCDIAVSGATVAALEEADLIAGAYPAPRRDSHAWFVLCGDFAVDCLQKLCGLDLRPQRFADLAVAQTSLARLSAILIRQDRGAVPSFHILADSASALYLWDVLIDSMDEFLGAPAGWKALRDLDPPSRKPSR